MVWWGGGGCDDGEGGGDIYTPPHPLQNTSPLPPPTKKTAKPVKNLLTYCYPRVIIDILYYYRNQLVLAKLKETL